MICEKCGKKIAEGAVLCPECGASIDAAWEALSPEERARKLWIQREKQRRKQKTERDNNLYVTVPEETQVEIRTLDTPLAQDIRVAMAELAEQEETPKEEAKASMLDEISLAVQEALDGEEVPETGVKAEETETLRQTKDVEQAVREAFQPEADSEPSESAEDEIIASEPDAEETAEPEPEAEEVPEEMAVIRESSSGVVTENSSVYINMEQAFEGHGDTEDFPDIRIPEIYTQARYVPENEDSAKWAEKAAVDEENDWEGFDPEAADWGDWSEKEGRMHPLVIVLIVLILAAAAGLAIYSCATSELFTLF